MITSNVPLWPEPGLPIFTFLPFKEFQSFILEPLRAIIWNGYGWAENTALKPLKGFTLSGFDPL